MIETMERARPLSFLPEIDDVTRREFLFGAAGLLLIPAGCGGGEEDRNGSTGGTRTVTDGYGRTVEVPVNPRRIVAIDYGAVAVYVTAMGLPVVASASTPSNPGGGVVPPEFVDGRKLEDIGDVMAPNVEKIARLDPDLIIAGTYTREQWEGAEPLAPVIAINDARIPQTGMFSLLRWLGRKLDREEEAERAEQETRELMGKFELLAGKKVAMINPLNYEGGSAGSSVYLYPPGSRANGFLTLIGATPSPSEIDGEAVPEDGIELSIERVPDLLADADAIIVPTYGLYKGSPDQLASLDKLRESEIWAKVPAVERGEVAYVEFEAANFNWGLEGVKLALKQLSEQLKS